MLRRQYGINQVVHIAAPTGSAAFNVGGLTIHNLCKISPSKSNETISGKKLQGLRATFHGTKVILIDERSQISAQIFGGMERVVAQSVYGGQNHSSNWGRIPVVILFGDDYQLPPVIQKGAFDMYNSSVPNTGTGDELRGFQELKLFSLDVMELTQPQRQKERKFIQILKEARHDNLSDASCHILSRLHIGEITDEDARQRIEKEALFAFSTNIKKCKHNAKALSELCCPGNPIAEISPIFCFSNMGRRSHFEHQEGSIPLSTYICRGARVAIKGRNINPAIGLFNGAMGTVVDIIYNVNEKPTLYNDKDPSSPPKRCLPRYVE
ncbi:MAG: hypothetical protein ACRDL7_02935, partial [Gaiellaceae bacterium]